MRSVELFAGAGGLGMGVARAGFDHVAVLEWDHDTCMTLTENRRLGTPIVSRWPEVEPTDVRAFDYSAILGDIDLVAGGPPCQPFSLGGKHRGFNDARDMFPEAVRAVRELRPRAFIFENVKGFLRQSFTQYRNYVYYQLCYPEVTRRTDEDWQDHLARLERHHNARHDDGLHYNVLQPTLLNAADFGVPQRRERVFFVGFRSDVAADWSFPHATHSLEALQWTQWIAGDYWERHGIALAERPEVPEKALPLIARFSADGGPGLMPWRTVRDAVAGLPDPEYDPAGAARFRNHQFNPGARAYPGHTGSPLDEPAKTLKAGDHGVPGGENMLVRPNGAIRYFSVRESARLQCFPDEYVFPRSWTESMRQLGNAVPVDLAHVVAESVRRKLDGGR